MQMRFGVLLRAFRSSEIEAYNKSGHHHLVYNISDYYDLLRVCHDYADGDTVAQESCEQNAKQEFIGGDNEQSAIVVIVTKAKILQASKSRFLSWLQKSVHHLNNEYHSDSGIRARVTGEM